MLQNNVNGSFPEGWYVKDNENAKLINLLPCQAAQLLLLLHVISKNSDFEVGGNVKFVTEANVLLMNTNITTLNHKSIF